MANLTKSDIDGINEHHKGDDKLPLEESIVHWLGFGHTIARAAGEIPGFLKNQVQEYKDAYHAATAKPAGSAKPAKRRTKKADK